MNPTDRSLYSLRRYCSLRHGLKDLMVKKGFLLGLRISCQDLEILIPEIPEVGLSFVIPEVGLGLGLVIAEERKEIDLVESLDFEPMARIFFPT